MVVLTVFYVIRTDSLSMLVPEYLSEIQGPFMWEGGTLILRHGRLVLR